MKSLCKIGYNMLCAHLKPKLTVFLCLVLPFLNAQKISSTQDRIIRKTIQNQFGEHESLKTNLQDYYNSVVVCGADTLYNPNGYFYVFKLVGDSCIRLDKSVFHGFNFGRFLFAYNNELYAFGGYGGFKANQILLKFNFNTAEWVYVHTIGFNKPENICGSAFIHENYLFSIGNIKPGNGVVADKNDTAIYKLNLNELTWSKLTIENNVFINPKQYLRALNYLICIKDLETVILNLVNLNFVIISNRIYNIKPEMELLYPLSKTKIVLKLVQNTLSPNSTLLKLNIDSIFNCNNKFLFISDDKATKANRFNWWIITPIILIILIILLLLLSKKYKGNSNKSRHVSSDDNQIDGLNNDIIKSLLQQNKDVLSIDELDAVLKINHLSFDSKKLKRHRLIKDINNASPGLITRIRSDEDQRQFKYKIKVS